MTIEQLLVLHPRPWKVSGGYNMFMQPCIHDANGATVALSNSPSQQQGHIGEKLAGLIVFAVNSNSLEMETEL